MPYHRFLLICLIALCPVSHRHLYAHEKNEQEVQQLIRHLHQTPDDVEVLRKLSFYYLRTADYDRSIEYGQRLFDLGYKQNDYHHAVLYAHICLGQAYLMKGEKLLPYGHLKQAELNATNARNDTALCSVYNGLGLYAANINKDYYQALDYYFNGIKAAKRCDNEQLHGILLANISEIYYLRHDTAGLKYSLECYEMGHRLSDPYLIYAGAATTAYLYHLTTDQQTALRYIREAEFVMLSNNFFNQANVYNLFGFILLKMNEPAEAIPYFIKALEKKEKGDVSSLIHTHLGYAQALMRQQQYKDAEGMLKAGLDLSYRQTNALHRDRLLLTLSQCLEAEGKLKEALTYQKHYQLETDSSYNAQRERAVNEIQVKYDLERHQNEARKARLAVLEKERHEVWLYAILLVITSIVVLLYYLYLRKNRLYRAIVRQNQQALAREKALQQRIDTQMRGMQPQQQQADAAPAEKPTTPTESKHLELLQQLEQLLAEQHIYTDNLLTKEKVAEMLGTNRTYLSAVINEQTGSSLTQYINNYRTQQAVRLLSDPSNQTPLKALCLELGFSSMTTFYSRFQEATGMTPAQYRKKVQELGLQ